MEHPQDGMATVFSSSDHNASIEADVILGMLKASGVDAILAGVDAMPGTHEIAVKVPESQRDDAEKLIAEAQEAGPEAAAEAEREFERDAQQP